MADKDTTSDGERAHSRSPRQHLDENRSIPASRDTNSNDSHALRCRLFIGNLNTDKTSKREVEELFSKYGAIASCSLHNNFGFVQFVEDKDADTAVLEMHGTTLFGKRIDVNLAGLRRKTQAKDKFESAPRKEDVVPRNMINVGAKDSPRPRNRSRSPMRGGHDGGYPRSLSPMSKYEELYRKDDTCGRPDERYGRDPYERPPYDRMRDFPPERRADPYTFDRRADAFPPRYERDYATREDPYRRSYDDYRPPQRVRPAIDCEIVSLSKDESRYAEEVESRLRSIGLVCNIGYPPPEIAVLEVVDRIARAGTLYAVVVTLQNAQHRSCTLNILHGTRQEHRNMPLDDALSFVARNFDSYLRVLREPFRGPAPSAYAPREEPRAYPPPQQPAAGGLPANEKKLSNDELNQMIEKLRREKEQRDTSGNTKLPGDILRRSEMANQLQDHRQEQPGGKAEHLSAPPQNIPGYSTYPPPQNSLTGSNGNPQSGSYYSQQQYNQPMYR